MYGVENWILNVEILTIVVKICWPVESWLLSHCCDFLGDSGVMNHIA